MTPIDTIRAHRDEERGLLAQLDGRIFALRADLAWEENRRLLHIAKIEAYDDILQAYESPETGVVPTPETHCWGGRRLRPGILAKFILDEIGKTGTASTQQIVEAAVIAGLRARSALAALYRLRRAGEITLTDGQYRIAGASYRAAWVALKDAAE